MSHQETLSKIRATGVVAVIRMEDPARLTRVVEAVQSGGVQCIEITMTVPGAIDIIQALAKEVPDDVVLGAGTVVRPEEAEAVIDAGASFVVAPNLNLEVVKTCRDRDIVVAPGCFSPTEIVNGWEAGADLIKVFPASVLGPKYFGKVGGPLPDIPLMPTGGVTVENAASWIQAGAVAVAIGSDLLQKEAIRNENYDVLAERAERLVQNVQNAKRALS